jgi:hypothetical protein
MGLGLFDLNIRHNAGIGRSRRDGDLQIGLSGLPLRRRARILRTGLTPMSTKRRKKEEEKLTTLVPA